MTDLSKFLEVLGSVTGGSSESDKLKMALREISYRAEGEGDESERLQSIYWIAQTALGEK